MFSKCCTIIAYVLSNYCQYIAQDLASLTIEAIYSIFIGGLKNDLPTYRGGLTVDNG